jgi:hypothetical protein
MIATNPLVSRSAHAILLCTDLISGITPRRNGARRSKADEVVSGSIWFGSPR